MQVSAMFRIMLTFSVTLLHGYVLWRAASTPFFKNRFSAGQLAGGGFVLWAVLVAGGIWAHGHEGPVFFCSGMDGHGLDGGVVAAGHLPGSG